MIVQPDFPDHYKTRLFVDLTGDPAAPIMILRLWAHCQNRRMWRFRNLTADALKAICRADALDASRLHEILVQVGFVDLEGDEVVVHDWDQVNGSLLRNWSNGKKGGRPRKQGDGGEGGHPGSPSDKRPAPNPNKTPGFRGVNPNETDKRRVEESREDSSLREEGEGKPSLPSGDGGGDGEGGHPGSPSDKRPAPANESEAGGSGAPSTDTRTPLDDILDLYHRHCPTLPRVLKVNDQRRKTVRARWKAAGEQKLDWFENLFRTAGQSQKVRTGTWCSFDWLMSPTNSQKVLEGNYADDRSNHTQKRRYIN